MNKRGLTLVEVLIALVIMVILILGLGSAVIAGLRAADMARERQMLSVATQSVLEQVSLYSVESIAALDDTQFEVIVGGEKVVPGYIQMDTDYPYAGSSDLCLVTMTHYPGDGSSEVLVRRIFGDTEPKAGETPTPPDLPPIADFEGEPRSGSVGLIVQFTDLSSGVINSWAWDFDNDGIVDSTEQNPTHQYNSEGDYTVKLTVTGPSGQDSAIKTDYIRVGALSADFEATPLYGAKPLAVTFTDLSTGDVTSWTWEYRKDGDTWTIFSNEQHPSFSFPDCGYYDVKLTVSDGSNTETMTKSKYIKVMPKLTVVSEYGDPMPSVGEHLYDPGETVTCSMPETLVYEGEDTRHRCVGWTATGGYEDSGSSSDSSISLSIPMTDDTTLTWNWVTEFRLRIKVDPDNGTNTVTATPIPPGDSTTDDVWTEIWYEEGSSVTLEASGSNFTGWAGTVSGTDNPFDITMSGPVDAIATFGKVLLEVLSPVTGDGFDPPLGTTTYNSGDSVTCSAPEFIYVDEETRYRCIGWEEGTGSVPEEGDGNSVTFTITENSSIKWKWQLEYLLHTEANPDSGGSVTVTDVEPSDGWPGDNWYPENSTVTLKAEPKDLYHFVAWQGDLTGSDNPATIFMNGPKSITAVFGLDQMTLVVYSDYGVPNPSVGAHTYDAGTEVTANCGTTPFIDPDNPNIRYVCTGYSGTGSVPEEGDSNSVTFTILKDSTLTWNWRTEYKLQITIDPSDGGTVTKKTADSDPDPRDWYPAGTSVELTAAPADTFDHWEVNGVDVGSANPFTVEMNEPKAVVAYFTPPLTITTTSLPSAMEGISYSFTVQATGGDPSKYQWSAESLPNGLSIDSNTGKISGIPAAGTSGNSPYKVKITLTDGTQTVSKEFDLVVNPPSPPVADFIADKTYGTAPLTVKFTDLSTNTPTSWSWDFDNDGTVDSNAQNPTHTYSTAGWFTVRLTVSNAAGSDTEVKEKYILVVASSSDNTIWYVDGKGGSDTNGGTSWDDAFKTIRKALSVADDYHLVLVADEAYNETNLDFNGKKIYLQGVDHHQDNSLTQPVIDCAPSGRAFIFDSGETEDAVIDNFTIQNGRVSGNGGAILCKQSSSGDPSSPTITNCTFTGNSANNAGVIGCGGGSNPTITNCTFTGNLANNAGVIGCGGGSNPTITNCTFTGNSANNNAGVIGCGGGSNPTITNCTFSNNSAGNNGGAILCNSSSPTITNCTFSGNRANDGNGGAILCENDSSPTITNCVFQNNKAADTNGQWNNEDGGAISCNGSSPTITNCTFSGNRADDDGGAIYCRANSSPTIQNCTFSGNTAADDGGAIRCYDNSSPTVTNCTFSGNSAGGAGGAISCESSSSPTLNNCILWDNDADGSGNEIYVSSSSSCTLNYCCVDDTGYGGSGTVNDDNNCIHPDSGPLFVDADSGNYRLKSSSPCIDKGYNNYISGVDKDLDGNPRRVDGNNDGEAVVDIGAYEYQP